MEFLKPTSDVIETIQEFRNKYRKSPFFNHLSSISEGIAALGWVTVVSELKLYSNNYFYIFMKTFILKFFCEKLKFNGYCSKNCSLYFRVTLILKCKVLK